MKRRRRRRGRRKTKYRHRNMLRLDRFQNVNSINRVTETRANSTTMAIALPQSCLAAKKHSHVRKGGRGGGRGQ